MLKQAKAGDNICRHEQNLYINVISLFVSLFVERQLLHGRQRAIRQRRDTFHHQLQLTLEPQYEP
jgi:hypothetical protein